jgi:alpha-glucosidase
VFIDGINADQDATGYKKEVIDITAGDKLKVKTMNGGGRAARFSPVAK